MGELGAAKMGLMFDVKLRNGRSIYLDSFFVSPTYAGLLEGRPNARINKIVLADGTKVAKRIWPDVSSVTLGPTEHELRPDVPMPRFQCMALFTSHTPAKDEAMCASH